MRLFCEYRLALSICLITMQSKIKDHIIKPIRRAAHYYCAWRIPFQKRRYASVLERVKSDGQCKVLFIASSLPMWRYHDVIRLLMDDPRFVVKVAIIPFKAFLNEDKQRDIDELKRYFAASGIDYEVVIDNYKSFKQEFHPDMIVYPQPYNWSYDDDRVNWRRNTDCLLMHTPYSVPLTEFEWYINIQFHNAAWKFYIASDIHQDVSRRIAYNRGENTVVVGELKSDQLTAPAQSNPLKEIADGKERKKLIWAPHFSVTSYDMFDRPDFNWSYKVMRDIAEQYADRLQIAFKPHPRLKSELYKNPEWGKERTDEFYSFWENSPTTQLETGDYIDLFKTSDALVHNCGSFTAEYLYMQKPTAYITRNLDAIKADMNAFGVACQDAHYIVASPEEIRRFIDDVVLAAKDPMKSQREDLTNTILRAPNGSTVAENIYNDLVKSLFG